jgi:lipopolysaccharide transport system ATP-binding protein
MSEIAIRVDRMSKQFRIGVRQEKYRTLRDTITRTASAPLRLFQRAAKKAEREASAIWALRDITFDVPRGEVVGVIGRNGAGKSTLLKILSRITEPTEGFAEIHGRVGSLLEVGTGFHPELTGRENIFLNGAILGMRRTEIERQFDEIVSFAEVEKFVDTAVKHYSSGMYLRLAFAVAAHMDPEILMVDEVLAVGDAAFQRKCIGKMGEIATQGRTVFFVSHNLGAVKELCTSSLVLSGGKLEFQGSVSEGIGRYSRAGDAESEVFRGTGWRTVDILAGTKGLTCEIGPEDPVTVRARLELGEVFPSGQIIFLIDNALGDTVVHQKTRFSELPVGSHHITASTPPLPLSPGVYTVYFKFLGNNEKGFLERHVSDRMVFEVRGSIQDLGRAVLAPTCEWDISPVNSSQFIPA